VIASSRNAATAVDSLRATFPAYLRCLVRAMPGRTALAVAATAAQAVVEAVAFLMLVPLLAIVGLDIGAAEVGDLAMYVRRAFAWLGLQATLGPVLAGYVVIVSVQALVAQAQIQAVLSLEHQFVGALRRRLCGAITRAKWLYLVTTRSSDLAHVLTQELERVGTLTYQVLSVGSSAVIGVVYIALAFRVSATMTLIVTGTAGALLVLLRGRLAVVRKESAALADARARLFGAAVEHVSSLRIAKSHGTEQEHIDAFARTADALATAHIDAIHVHLGSRTVFNIGAVTGLVLILYVGLAWLKLSPASMVLLLYVFTRTMPRLSTVQQGIHGAADYLTSFASYSRLQAAVDAEAEVPPTPLLRPVTFRDSITLESVTFAHARGADEAIHDLMIDIPFGAITGIVGHSGAGKSTLADLVTCLQRPQSGRVLIDGIPLDAAMIPAWKRQIGYVDQDTFLFNESVRANLLWANPSATDEDLRRAVSLAAAEFVFDLPQGLDTTVGDRGIRLSGGERQRLALARALIREPSLLVLDEATSALDADNEMRILGALERLRGQVTVVLITHRLSAVRCADVIYLLDNGHVIESGDWSTLIGNPVGRFRSLCAAQGVNVQNSPLVNRAV